MKQVGNVFAILGLLVVLAAIIETVRFANDPAAEGTFLGNLGGSLVKRILPAPL